MWPHLLVDVLFPSFFSKIELLLNSVFKSVSSILNWQVLSFNEDQKFFFLLLIICTLRVFNLKTYTYKYVSALHFVLSLLPWVHWLINVFTIYHHTYYLLRLIILWDQKYSKLVTCLISKHFYLPTKRNPLCALYTNNHCIKIILYLFTAGTCLKLCWRVWK